MCVPLTQAGVMTGLRSAVTFCWSVCFQSVCVSLLNTEEVNTRLAAAARERAQSRLTIELNDVAQMMSEVFSGRAVTAC